MTSLSLLDEYLYQYRENVQLRDAGPGRGRGLFTVRSFTAGEEIFAETSLLCCSQSSSANLRRAAVVARSRRPGVRVMPRNAVTVPPPPLLLDTFLFSRKFLAVGPEVLNNFSPLQVTSAPLPVATDTETTSNNPPLCTLRLNDVLRENAAEADFAPRAFPALLLLLSMINHDCRPSAGWQSSWDETAQQPLFSVRAARAMKVGEEITFSYCPVDAPTSTRRAQLTAGWRFTCACERCTKMTSAAAQGDDTMVLRCSVCSGAVPCGFESAGCTGCGAEWSTASAGGGVPNAAAAAALRTDVLWWARDEPHLTVRVDEAITRVHPHDCELRRILRDVIDSEFNALEEEDGGAALQLCACRIALLVRAADTIFSGFSSAPWMASLDVSPIPHLIVADVYSLLAVSATTSTICIRSDSTTTTTTTTTTLDVNKKICLAAILTNVDQIQAREKAALSYINASKAARRTARNDSANEFVRVIEEAATSPPLTLPDLLLHRAARISALSLDTRKAGARINAESATVLWGEEKSENGSSMFFE